MKELSRKVMLFVIFNICVLVIAELIVRFAGFKPYNQWQTKLRLESMGEKPYLPDNAYMVMLNNGHYTLTINGGVKHTVTHVSNERITKLPYSVSASDHKIYILGCSFTYGMGVSDTETYAALLSKQYPDIDIHNLARPGLSNLHSYLLLKEKIDEGNKPTTAFISISDMHLSRNVLTNDHRRVLYEAYLYHIHHNFWKENEAQAPGYSYVNSEFQIDTVSVSNMYRHFPLSNRLAIAYLLNNTIDNFYDYLNRDKYQSINQHVISLISELARKEKIKVVFFDFLNGSNVQTFKEHFLKEKVPFITATIDWTQKDMYNLPYDPHPSAKGHLAIYSFLNSYPEYFNSSSQD